MIYAPTTTPTDERAHAQRPRIAARSIDGDSWERHGHAAARAHRGLNARHIRRRRRTPGMVTALLGLALIGTGTLALLGWTALDLFIRGAAR